MRLAMSDKFYQWVEFVVVITEIVWHSSSELDTEDSEYQNYERDKLWRAPFKLEISMDDPTVSLEDMIEEELYQNRLGSSIGYHSVASYTYQIESVTLRTRDTR